jgi:hypothetical protein
MSACACFQIGFRYKKPMAIHLSSATINLDIIASDVSDFSLAHTFDEFIFDSGQSRDHVSMGHAF